MIFHGRGAPVVARFLGPGGREGCCFDSGARRKIKKATGTAASCAAASPVASICLRAARLRSTKRQPESAGLGQSRHAFSSRRPGIIFRNFLLGKRLDSSAPTLRRLSRLKHLQPVAVPSCQFPSFDSAFQPFTFVILSEAKDPYRSPNAEFRMKNAERFGLTPDV
jgi:hypothetical protein